MSEEYMANVRSMDATNRTSHLKKIENAFVKSREYGDDKVQLAMQTYEMVSKYNCFLCITMVAQHLVSLYYVQTVIVPSFC